MKLKYTTLLATLGAIFALAIPATSPATGEVCGPDCWGDLGGGWYSLPWTSDPVILNDDDGDNASSICAGKGGVTNVEFVYRGGQTLAIVTCGDGSVHTIETGRSTSSAEPESGDGNPNHTFEEGPPAEDHPTEYINCWEEQWANTEYCW